MNTHDLANRLDTLESRAAIDRLISQYAQAFDSRDEALLRGIWHHDARLSLGSAFGDVDGIEAIMDSAKTNWAQMPHMHHWMANVLIEIDGDRATARTAADILCTHVDMGPIQISGLYRDRFERREGRWAFVERVLDLHFVTPLANWKPVAGSEAKVEAAVG
jgi:hypothetical protein